MSRHFATKLVQLAALLALATAFAGPAETCTHALYVGDDGLVITGRSMDWGPLIALPAFPSSSTQFPRNWHTITAVPAGTYENQAVASVLSVMRSIGVPLGVTHPTKPKHLIDPLAHSLGPQEQGAVFRLGH